MLGHHPVGHPFRLQRYLIPNSPGRLLLAAILAAMLVIGCSSGKKNTTSTAPPASATPSAVASVASSTQTPAPPTVVPSPALVRPFTPPPSTPQPTATPIRLGGIRTENGLQIQDEQFLGRVTTPGGVRIRSAPDASAQNVVGSVPEGALVTVEGKVLNGTEAEPGKGTVWYIVGPKQYIYGAEGYVQRVDGTTAR